MKDGWDKRETRFKTDKDIILNCLYEAYGYEMNAVLSGKNIRHTMIFPFLRMLSNDKLDEQEIHKKLWSIYKENQEKEKFVARGQEYLKSIERTTH